jgi:ABC-type bacteriocin/lantibiotic exporter with double-glycine peptidase domain
MNLVLHLLSKYFYSQMTNSILLVLVCLLLNIVQTNGISIAIANIIRSVETNSTKNTYTYYYGFVGLVFLYILLFYIYKQFQNALLTRVKPWVQYHLTHLLMLQNNENLGNTSFIQLNPHINRMARNMFLISNDILTFFLPTFFFLLVITGYLFYQDSFIGGAFVFGNLGLFAYMYSFWRDLLHKNETHERHDFTSEVYLIDMLNNFDKIIYRGQISNEMEAFEKYTNNTIDSGYKYYSSVNVYETAMITISYATVAVILGYMVWLFFHKKMSNVAFITLITILMLYRDKIGIIIQQVTDIIEFVGRMKVSMEEFEKINLISAEMLEEKREYSAVELPFDRVVFEKVSFKYANTDKPIFENLDLSITFDRNIIGITGISGKGKSTFVKLLLKMYDYSGNIFLDGVNIKEVDADYIRQNIVYVNQTAKLFDKKVFENIRYGCENPDKCEGKIKAVFEKYPKIERLFKNMDIYEKSAGSLGENLSGGQRQVVNIIGGFIQPGSIVVLDEPTNALDGDLKREVLRLIQDYSKEKKSVLIITHDRDVFPLFQSTIRL